MDVNGERMDLNGERMDLSVKKYQTQKESQK